MDKIAVVDFGGQYAHLIANRVRRLKVYTEIIHPASSVVDVKDYKGIIFSGGPSSVYCNEQPDFNSDLLHTGLPTLGICFGHQLICLGLGGSVSRGNVHEFGASFFRPETSHPLFNGLKKSTRVWMSHGDEVTKLPEDFECIGKTEDCKYAAVADDEHKIYGLQFHPEVTHTDEGLKILENFISICDPLREWDMEFYLEVLRNRINEQCRGKKVFLLVSGGVDSTVTFALLNKILGPDNVIGLHIDNGMMRKNESADIINYMKAEGFNNLRLCDAGDMFLGKLKGITAPEQKRKIIGDAFFEALGPEIAKLNLNEGEFLMAQGTTYPDTIESGGTKHAATIKTHHNRVPAVLEMLEKGLIIEPLAELYKDEVRALGTSLDIPDELVWRHPFPGPGLGVRLLCNDTPHDIIDPELRDKVNVFLESIGTKGMVIPIRSVGVQGDSRTYAHPCLIRNWESWQRCELISTVTTNQIREINRVVLEVNKYSDDEYQLAPLFCEKQNLDFLREVDHVCTRTLMDNSLYRSIWQMPVVLLPITLAGRPVIVMRPINSSEAMTASFAEIDMNILQHLWGEIKNLGAGALWYDITHKPPGTIEWE